MRNIKHITQNDTAQLTELCMSTGTKAGLNETTSVSQEVCQMENTLTCPLNPNIDLKMKSAR